MWNGSRDEVDVAPERPGQFVLKVFDLPAEVPVRQKLVELIKITVRTSCATRHGAKAREHSHAIPLTDGREPEFVNTESIQDHS